MHWKVKAAAQSVCATLPFGGRLYRGVQSLLGNSSRVDLARKLAFHHKACRLMIEHGFRPRGATVVEVGTGWLPLDAIGFWIGGASRVVTLDLNRQLDWGQLGDTLTWMSERPDELVKAWSGLATESDVRERHASIVRLRQRPQAFLEEAGIEYRAPSDAAETGLPDGSADAHFSYNVFEHVPPPVLDRLLVEARRILKPDGVGLHYVDPSDHFAHFDPSITRVNFLRFDPGEWDRLAGNRFAYHNRLRDPDYRALFEHNGMRVDFARYDVEPRSLAALRSGLPLAASWRGGDPEELARHNLVYIASPA